MTFGCSDCSRQSCATSPATRRARSDDFGATTTPTSWHIASAGSKKANLATTFIRFVTLAPIVMLTANEQEYLAKLRRKEWLLERS